MAGTDFGAQIERLGPKHVDAGLALSDEAGWNQTAADWAYFLSRGLVFGLPDAQGSIVASAALLPYPPAAWISLVLVSAAWRRRGMASALFACCLREAQARGLETWLDATPAGAKVYEKVGFRGTGRTFLRLRRGGSEGSPERAKERTIPDGLPRLAQTDALVMGFDRVALLEELSRRPGSRVYGNEGAVCLVREGRRASQIGPLYAEDEAACASLLTSLAGCEGRDLIIDVAGDRPAVLNHLRELGFAGERPFLRMRRGASFNMAKPDALMAIAGPEFG